MGIDPQAPEYKESENPRARQPQPLPGVEARAGVTGHKVRYVLAFGLIGVVVAFVIVYLIYFV